MARPSFRLRYLGGVLMLCGVIALAACGGGGTSTSSNTGGSSGGTTTATGSNAQAQQIAQKVQQANLKSADVNLQATLSSQNNGGATTSSTGQITLNPARAQLTTTSSTNTSTSNSNQTKTDEIIDNNKIYVRQAGQTQWHEVTLPNNTTQSLPFVSLQNFAQMQNLQVVGTESVNGVQAYHLRGNGSQSAQGQSGSYTEDVWVNKDNYQPIKMTVVAQTSQGTLTANATFSNWNGNQTITPPPSNEIAH